MKKAQLSLDDIKPYQNNAKKHPKKQVKLIAESIRRFGFDSPIIVDKENIIIAGHGRYEAAQLLGLKAVPIIRKEDLTEEEVKAYRLADNKIAESGWDMDLVKGEMFSMDKLLAGITGFSLDLMLKDDPRDDDVPDVPVKPKAKCGDIYQLGAHRLMCGDSTSPEDVDKLMGGCICPHCGGEN